MNMKLIPLVPLLVLSVLDCASLSKTNSIDKSQVEAALAALEDYIIEAQTKTGVPGVSVAVVFKDEVVYLKGFGVRDTNTNEPVSEDTVFQIASLSKPIGATAIAALVSEKIVSWNDKISVLDPSFSLRDPYPTSQLTVRDLYTHRSGLPGNAGNDLEELGFARDEILARLRYLNPSSSFRAGYAYSNFGMTQGGVAAVKPTGKTWETMLREKLYAPLGMSHTTSLNADFLKETNVAKLHIKMDGKWQAKLTRQPDPQSPAGGVSSTARDMAQWLKLQIGKGKFNGEQIIKEDEILVTHEPIMYRGKNPISGNPGFYALGWVTEYDRAGRTIWTHNGAFSTGARTIATIYPDDQLGIVVLANAFPTGIPEAISASFFDLVHDGKVLSDHLTPWENAMASILQVPAQAAIEAYKNLPSPVEPALGNDAYLGTYSNDYWGDVDVVGDGTGLALEIGPQKMKFPLKHWNGNVFLAYMTAEIPEMPSPVTFTIGADNKASQFHSADMDSNGAGTLVRK